MCINPVILRQRDQIVPCGHCVECLSSLRSQWIFRIKAEAKHSLLLRFLTLTYNDENLMYTQYGEASLCKEDCKKYFKRVRKKCKEVRYFAVGEYGSIGDRPHMHAIVFNAPDQVLADAWVVNGESKGFVKIDECNDNTIAYCTKYIINEDQKYVEKERPFRLMSKGLGRGYLDLKTQRFYSERKKTTVINDGGFLTQMPRYYKEKIFTKEEANDYADEPDLKELQARYNEIEFKKKVNSQKSKCKKL